MKLLVVLVLAHATFGSPIDTPEVEAAKKAHLLAHSIATARANSAGVAVDSESQYKSVVSAPEITSSEILQSPYKSVDSSPSIASSDIESSQWPYKSVLTPPAVSSSEYLPIPAEIAAAKAAHSAEIEKWKDHSWESHIVQPYSAPSSIDRAYLADAHAAYLNDQVNGPRIASPYYNPASVPDTPEVALAKAVHLAEHARASAVANALVDQYYSASLISNPLGYIPDTPEVAAAKVAHLAAKLAAIESTQ